MATVTPLPVRTPDIGRDPVPLVTPAQRDRYETALAEAAAREPSRPWPA